MSLEKQPKKRGSEVESAVEVEQALMANLGRLVTGVNKEFNHRQQAALVTLAGCLLLLAYLGISNRDTSAQDIPEPTSLPPVAGKIDPTVTRVTAEGYSLTDQNQLEVSIDDYSRYFRKAKEVLSSFKNVARDSGLKVGELKNVVDINGYPRLGTVLIDDDIPLFSLPTNDMQLASRLGINLIIEKIPQDENPRVVEWIGEIEVEKGGNVEQYGLIIERKSFKQPRYLLLEKRPFKGKVEQIVRKDFVPFLPPKIPMGR